MLARGPDDRRSSRRPRRRSIAMGIKTYKPTSAGRRHGSVLDYSEITRAHAREERCSSRCARRGGRNNHGRITSRHRGGGNKRMYRIIDFKRDKDGIPAKVAVDRVRPQPHARTSRCCTTRTARSATSSRRSAWRSARRSLSGPAADPLPGQLPPARPTSRSACRSTTSRCASGQRRADRAARRAPTRSSRRARATTHRDPMPSGEMRKHPRRVPRDDRAARQHRPPERQARQGRPQPPPRLAAARARHGDEPGRPPARAAAKAAPRADGIPCSRDRRPRQGRQDAQAASNPTNKLHPAPPKPASTLAIGTAAMSRSVKKGPFVDAKLAKKVARVIASGKREPDQDMGAPLARSRPISSGHTFMVHNGKPAPEGLRHRGHGRAQARRVLPHARLPRPHEQEGS